MSALITKQEREIKTSNILLCMFIIAHHVLHMTMQELPADITWMITDCIYNILSVGIYGAILLVGLSLTYSYKSDQSGKLHFQRAKNAVMPYIIAVFFYWIVLFIFGETELNPSLLVLHIISGNLTTHFFLPIAIIQFIILLPIIYKILTKWKPGIVLAIALALNVASIVLSEEYKFLNSVFVNYLYVFVIGAYAGLNYSNFKEFLSRRFKVIALIYILVTVILESFVYTLEIETQYKTYLQIVNLIFHPLATMFWISLCLKITNRIADRKPSGFFTLVSESTYHIYLWYAIFLLIANTYINNSETVTAIAGFAIRCLVTVLAVALVIIIRYFTLKNKKED